LFISWFNEEYSIDKLRHQILSRKMSLKESGNVINNQLKDGCKLVSIIGETAYFKVNFEAK
jgi:hypothetical protein